MNICSYVLKFLAFLINRKSISKWTLTETFLVTRNDFRGKTYQKWSARIGSLFQLDMKLGMTSVTLEWSNRRLTPQSPDWANFKFPWKMKGEDHSSNVLKALPQLHIITLSPSLSQGNLNPFTRGNLFWRKKIFFLIQGLLSTTSGPKLIPWDPKYCSGLQIRVGTTGSEMIHGDLVLVHFTVYLIGHVLTTWFFSMFRWNIWTDKFHSCQNPYINSMINEVWTVRVSKAQCSFLFLPKE